MRWCGEDSHDSVKEKVAMELRTDPPLGESASHEIPGLRRPDKIAVRRSMQKWKSVPSEKARIAKMILNRILADESLGSLESVQ